MTRIGTFSLISVALVAGLLVAGCGDEAEVCVRGETQPCACPNGITGAQVCSADRQGWESCDCGGADAGPDAGLDVGPDASPDVEDADIGDEPDAGCPEPTLEQCQDTDWLETDACGIAEHEAMQVDPESTCNQLLLEEADRLSEEAEEQDDVLPEELGGGTGTVREEDNPERRLDEVSLPLTYTGFSQETAVEASETGLSAEEQAFRDQWEANGNRVATCREYVYEKYYDYTRFEDAVAARSDDLQYVADVAFGSATDPMAIGTRGAGGGTLAMRDGTAMTVQGPEGRVCYDILDCRYSYPGDDFEVQNIFLAMPRELFGWSAAGTSTDSSLQMYIDNDRCYQSCDPIMNPAPPPWQWHLDRHAAALEAGLSDVEMEAMYPTVLAFREALDDYARLQEADTLGCCPTHGDTPAPGSDCEPYYAECASVEARLVDLFDEAYDAGCLVTPYSATTTVCDWSPAYFVETLRAAFDSAMEADYQRCIDLTGDDFDDLSDYTFYLPGPTPWEAYPATDYTVSASAVDLFFSRHEEYLDALHQWYLSQLPDDLFDPQGQVRAPGNVWSNDLQSGNEAFGVFLHYLVSWGLTNFDPEGDQTQADMCLVGFEAVGSLTVGGWAFWSDSVDIVDAYARLGLASGEGSEGHFYVLGMEIWDQDPTEEFQIARSWDRTETLLEKEKVIRIYGVPVGKLTGGVAGTLGLALGANATGGRAFDDLNENGHVDANESCSLDTTLFAWFTPWARLDAYGSMGPYIEIADAGARVDVTLVRLDLPFTFDLSLASTAEEAGSMIFDVNAGADLVLRTLDGRISAYAKLGICPFCYTAKKVLFSWSGLQWAWDLFDFDYFVPVGYLLEAMRPQ